MATLPVTGRSRAAFVLLLLVTAVHLGAQLFASNGLLSQGTQILLMPTLAAVLWFGAERTDRLVRLVLVGLFFSWLGDSLPRFLDGDAGFLVMVGAFFVAQAVYVAAFLPFGGRSRFWRSWSGWPYVLAFLVLMAVISPGAADASMLFPVVAYAVVITVMALLAPGVHLLAGIGAALFMLSDSLIALNAFADVSLPGQGFWVMLTYVAGQSLIVLGVLRTAEGEGVHRPAVVS